MIYISHRGNISGIIPELENSPSYITEALNQGYYVEIDLWVVNDLFYLGHDEPQYQIEESFLNNKYFYIHCKNSEALLFMSKTQMQSDYFWHQDDKYTLTSKNIIWVHPTAKLLKDSICVLPEISRTENLLLCHGICSDFIERYKNA
jgi:hypothetical protein